jgi:uncharacterized membrane protein YfhO
LGNAWFVKNIDWVPNADSEMLALSHFNPATTAVINQSYKKQLNGFTPQNDSSANIKLTQYGLNKLEYKSSNSQNGLAVFSDIYYPAGWKAFIDNKEVPIIRVNYLLRGLEIPAGTHTIEFRFHPETFFTGQKISGISSIALLILLVLGIVMEIYRRSKQPVVTEKPHSKPIINKK